MAPTLISPTEMRLTRVDCAEAVALRAPGWTPQSGHLIELGHRGDNHTAGENYPAVRVLLADGGRLIRAALRQLLERESDIEVPAEAATGREAVVLARRIRPDVVLMNARFPGVDGLEATRLITADPELSAVKVLIRSEDARDEDLFSAVRAGASGFLTGDSDPAELLRAVRVVASGGAQLSPSVTRRLIDEFASRPAPRYAGLEPFEELTGREREVVALVALGLTNSEIADRLVMSPATAKTHVSHSMVKLHTRNRAKLVALAYQTGFALPSYTHDSPSRLRHMHSRR